jgi:LPS sulfotransferase NodH
MVLTQARTGSNMLVSMLDSHPNIKCFGEVFNPASSFGYINWQSNSYKRRIAHKYLRDYNIERYIDSLLSVGPEDNTQAVGFKVIYPGQFDRWPNLRCYCRENDFKVISLIRKNLIRKYISSKIANFEGVWSTQERREKSVSIEIDISDLSRFIDRIETIYHLIDSLTVEFRGIQISYEELSSNRESVMIEVLQFLGIEELEVQALKAKTAKQNPERLEQVIQNYDEVCSFINKTRYKWCLEE